MPGSDYSALRGGAITQALRQDLDMSAAVITGIARREDAPLDYRAKLIREEVAAARAAVQAARQAMATWADATAADASARRDRVATGTAADESRRVASELRVSRMVTASLARGSGSEDAATWAQRASAAYDRMSIEEAREYSAAALAVDPKGRAAGLAREVSNLVAFQEIQADPARRQAFEELAALPVAEGIHARDESARLSRVLKAAAGAFQALAETAGPAGESLRQEATPWAMDATRASMAAKMAEYAASQAEGRQYQEPEGALPSVPTGEAQPIHGDLPPRGIVGPSGQRAERGY